MASIRVHKRQRDYYGHTLRVLAVHIDGQLVSDSFQLFDASSEAIVSHICEECYAATRGAIATCGDADIAVRKHGDTIYWFLADYECVNRLVSDSALNYVWSFPLDEYESQLTGDSSGLPDFCSDEIQLLLNRCTLYRPDLGLYTIPDLEGDSQGRLMLDRIAQSIRFGNLRTCRAPDRFRTVRIGIETDGIPETVVDIGMVDQRTAIRFVANPSFPLWCTSDGIHRNFVSILA